ncbi:hypothetical protein WJX75_002265 [Coccomyxa subellipsoidea]|uniref:DUF3741 domain-containing protein n=1 Tax=Coccomyxa subellipsoidea TaxID=248742 RepID=A0ABR2YG28_9CHLO
MCLPGTQMDVQDTGNAGVTMLAGARSAASNFNNYAGLKRKDSEVYPPWRDDSKEKRARIGSPVVCGPLPSPSGGSTQTPLQLNALSHDPSRSSPLQHLAFGDPELLKRQLQQMALLQQHSDASVQASVRQPSLPPGPPDGIQLPKGSALSLDPSFSASGREPTTAKPEGPSHSQNSSGFLVQQPSSKLWMEAVPMRTGTKASTSYRVYSNAFMEGRRPNGVQGNGHVGPGIPSISSPAQRGRPVLPMRARPSTMSEPAQMLASRQRSLEASPAGPVAAHRAQQPPQQPQGTPMDVVRLAHAAADRVLQRRLSEQSRTAGGPAEMEGRQEVEGRMGSAGSCDALPVGQPLGSLRQRSGSFGQAPTGPGGHSGSGRDLDAAAVASQLDQERQLAALMMIQDCAAAGAASLLSSGPQGSSNLIYILKSLQASRSNPGALLAQLQAAQESPRQQLALMRMLRESLSLPNQAPPRQPSPDQPPPRGSPREGAQLDAIKKRRGPAAKPAIDDQWQQGSRGDVRQIPKAPTPPAEAGSLRISHEEALQRMEAQAQLRARANAGNAERMSRVGSDSGAAERQQNGSRKKAFLSEGSPHARALDTSRTDSPGPSEALSGPSLIFNDSATSKDRLKRLNPYNGLHAEQYTADSGRRPGCRTKGGVPSNTAETACAAPARTAVGRPVSRPVSPPRAVPKQEDTPVGPALGPGKEGLEREAAETLLFLTGMEREELAAAPVAAAESPVGRSKVGTVVEASAPADAPEVSPLQALVQDIMQQQKQRAQVNALASLPKSVARADVRGGYGGSCVPARIEIEPPPAQPVRRKPGRPPKKRPEELAAAAAQAAAQQPVLYRQASAGRLSVLGFAVPSGRRTGGKSGRPTAHSGYSAGRSGRHWSSGSSGNLSERDGPGTFAGVPGPRPRRLHRPADFDSGGEFSGGSSDARSVDSGSWNTKEYAKRARRK